MSIRNMKQDGYKSMEEFCRSADDSKIAAVLAILRSPVTDGKTVLIVEGADDVSVYSRFFNVWNCTLMDVVARITAY